MERGPSEKKDAPEDRLLPPVFGPEDDRDLRPVNCQ